MVRIVIYIILLSFICNFSNAQKSGNLQTEVWTNYRFIASEAGFDPGINGGGISVGYNRQFLKDYQGNLSGEFGAAGLSNYVAFTAGLARDFRLKASGIVVVPGISLFQGMALFKPSPLYMWGVEQLNFVGYRLKNSSIPGVVLGFRFYGFPGYSAYSNVNRFLDVRAGLRFVF